VAHRAVAAGLFNLGILAVSGFLRGRDGFLASVHTLAGHLMAPLVAAAIGLWLGSPSLDTKLGPIRMLLRLVFFVCARLLVLVEHLDRESRSVAASPRAFPGGGPAV